MRLQKRRFAGSRKGYVMLVALILMTVLTVVGSTSLTISGVDQQIAIHNGKHMMMLNTADAGVNHARDELGRRDPVREWHDLSDADDTAEYFVGQAAAEYDFGGISYAHNLGVYEVSAVFERCGSPPPGYSTELGNQHFRSDYWRMESVATMTDGTYALVNESTATVVSIIRKAVEGPCKLK